MDPAVKAAAELTTFFQQLEIPCEVKVSTGDGKYVVATEALPEPGFTLVEEVPIVSWPTRSFLDMRIPFCFHCLRRDRGETNASGTTAAAEHEEGEKGPPTSIQWSECELCHSKLCCDACRAANHRTHLLLCSALANLREAGARGEEEQGRKTDRASGRASMDDEGSITPEAVARCAAWLVARVANAITRSGCTRGDLSAEGSGPALVRQLFTQAAAPFDRLIGAPDTADFAGIRDPQVWFTLIRQQLRERVVKLLLCAAAGDGKDGDGEGTEGTSAATEPSSSSALSWADELAEAALSNETLRTFLGQLVLNAHAVNDYVLLDDKETESESPENKRLTVPTSSPSPALQPPLSQQQHRGDRFAWVMKGAAVYSLLSAFNHSCEPNVGITNVDGTHEIAIKTTRPVAKGEELHITYIPLREGSTAKERRAQLRGYFFTCQCPRCVAEDRAAA